MQTLIAVSSIWGILSRAERVPAYVALAQLLIEKQMCSVSALGTAIGYSDGEQWSDIVGMSCDRRLYLSISPLRIRHSAENNRGVRAALTVRSFTWVCAISKL